MFCKFLLLASLLSAIVGRVSASVHGSTEDVQVTFSNAQKIIFDTDGAGPLDISFARIFYLNSTYYWIGQSERDFAGSVPGAYKGGAGMRSYSSNNLKNWTDQGLFVTYDSPSGAVCEGNCGRPHILFNEETKKYVLWANAAGGFYAWTSETPIGPYELRGRVNTPGFSGDFTINKIGNKAYVSRSSFNFTTGGTIWPPFEQTQVLTQLTSDYLNTTGPSYSVRSAANDEVDRNVEAPNMFERDGWIYLTASTTCGNCNDGPLLAYRTQNITSNIWTRQIISGDTCGGQTSGVSVIRDSAGSATYLHTADLFRGYGPLTLKGKGLVPLSFNSDASIQDLDCAPTANFTFNAIRGTGPASTGKASEFTDSSASDAAYEVVCDLDEYNIYQTWQNSKNGTLKEVGLNMGSQEPTSDFFIAVYRFTSNEQFFMPSARFETLYNATLSYNQTSYGSGQLALNLTDVSVTQGDRLALAITGKQGLPASAGDYCYLSKAATGPFNVTSSTRTLFYNGVGDISPRGKTGTLSPVKVKGGEISWYSIVV